VGQRPARKPTVLQTIAAQVGSLVATCGDAPALDPEAASYPTYVPRAEAGGVGLSAWESE